MPRAAPAFLPGLSIGRRAQAVERGLQDRLEIAGVAVDLGDSDIDLSGDLLDRIDAIVPPGVTVNVAANMWRTPALDAGFRRR